jgi:hypothetical protein
MILQETNKSETQRGEGSHGREENSDAATAQRSLELPGAGEVRSSQSLRTDYSSVNIQISDSGLQRYERINFCGSKKFVTGATEDEHRGGRMSNTWPLDKARQTLRWGSVCEERQTVIKQRKKCSSLELVGSWKETGGLSVGVPGVREGRLSLSEELAFPVGSQGPEEVVEVSPHLDSHPGLCVQLLPLPSDLMVEGSL